MTYNWDGDVIIQESSIANKRFVIGNEKTPITTDIREFVSPQDDAVIKGILKKLVTANGLPTEKNPGDFDKRAMIIWDYVARSIAYKFDYKRQFKEDFWLFPAEVLTLKKGDCEDGSFLLASLLIGSGISPFNVRVVLGNLYDGEGKLLGGHCWPIYKDEAGHWCILESALDRAGWSMPTVDVFADGQIKYVPYFCFNTHHLWAIRHKDANYKDVKSYLTGRGALANLANPEFPSGGFIGTITGDNSPGHKELTSEVLREFDFSDDAISVAADASQDPDLYEWDNHSAHAQTKNNIDGLPFEPEHAVQQYLDWLEDKFEKCLSFGTQSTENALFFLGYMLHGIQDLAAHQGVTNALHSYESFISLKKDQDRDHLEINRTKGKFYSSQFLEKLKSKHPHLFESMRTFESGFSFFGPKVSKSEKCTLLGKKGWDFSVQGYLEYRDLAKKYELIKDTCPSTEWNRDMVFESILALI